MKTLDSGKTNSNLRTSNLAQKTKSLLMTCVYTFTSHNSVTPQRVPMFLVFPRTQQKHVQSLPLKQGPMSCLPSNIQVYTYGGYLQERFFPLHAQRLCPLSEVIWVASILSVFRKGFICNHILRSRKASLRAFHTPLKHSSMKQSCKARLRVQAPAHILVYSAIFI